MFYLFCIYACFFLEEGRLLTQVVVLLDPSPSVFIRNEMEDENGRFSMKRRDEKEQYSIGKHSRELSSVLYPFMSYNTEKDVPF